MRFILAIFIIFIISLISCVHEPLDTLEGIPYKPTPYEIKIPAEFPNIQIPADNPLTVEGITLGRDLFYDKILSGDNTMSCSSCHDPKKAFTDGKPVSTGIAGIPGKRSSMSLINVGFIRNGLFWDGRAATLEEQAALPVEDDIELHTTWPEVEKKLQNHKEYPKLFRKAFGIKSKSEITKDLAIKAIAQFERILISGNSKYDKAKRGEVELTNDELVGFSLYTDIEGDDLPDAECHHCHQLDLATADAFFNNGFQEAPTLNDFKDLGKGGVSKQIAENGKMKAPTLRNIMLTAPYMHNGSLKTIEDVIEHYDNKAKYSPNRDALIRKLNLTPYQKKALIAFLHTLTDTSYLDNPLVVKK